MGAPQPNKWLGLNNVHWFMSWRIDLHQECEILPTRTGFFLTSASIHLSKAKAIGDVSEAGKNMTINQCKQHR